MAEVTHLTHAPIKEALIDIQVERRSDLSITDLAKATDRLSERFPKVGRIDQNRLDFKLDAGKAPVTNIDHTHHGYRFTSSDGRQIVQFKLDGFTFNWLEPYTTWEELSQQARSAWDIYEELTDPLSVTRLGVRYINHLAFPQPLASFSDYLAAPPAVPAALPQTLESFLSRVVIHDGDLDAQCILTQAMEHSDPEHENIPVFLDIDTIINRRFALNDDFWGTIQRLRDLKNRVFFESITNKTVELYK